MPKAFCMTGMVIAILILLLFALDLALPTAWAPFKKASMLMDSAFVLCSIGLAYISWATYTEQS